MKTLKEDGVESGSFETPENVMSVTILGVNTKQDKTIDIQADAKKKEEDWKTKIAKSIVNFNESVDLCIIPNVAKDSLFSLIYALRESYTFYDVDYSNNVFSTKIIKQIILSENSIQENSSRIVNIFNSKFKPRLKHSVGLTDIDLVFEDEAIGESLTSFIISLNESLSDEKLIETFSVFTETFSGIYINPVVEKTNMGGVIEFSVRR